MSVNLSERRLRCKIYVSRRSEPEVVAHIEFTEWMPDAHLRQSAFVGLRENKDLREVVREMER
jgi:ATP-dependent DNA ligase